MVVQQDLGFFLAPALAAQKAVRAAGSTEDLEAAAELKQAPMLQQIEDLQRQLAAVRASDGELLNPGVMALSGLAATPAALDDFEVGELIADASAILRQRIPYQPSSNLTFPSEVPTSGSFLGGVLGRSPETGLPA